ncbi:AsmA family protein [Candidatus Tokpelaia sp.]|uniref:AsmA family protein n=1 Tax=Candidatus Tokpelaia sp. TaxID=2233777 RepID=UPI0012392816|nr:hypothetical protein [Candidatus Tokpelaia sp.]KAA6404561.1 hypothetical protein DPQ22_09285 [Candidatus Tokpelaia sp.]
MSLKAGLKLCILCLVLLFLSLAIFIALLPFLVSTDAIRLRLAHDLSSMTGYNVQLREPPQITVFPSFQASLPHVVLTDNSQANAPLMNAEKIIVHMSLLDALRRRARFSETRLVRPHFTLTEPVRTASLFAAFARSEGNFGSKLRETQNRLSETAQAGRDNSAQLPLLLQPFGRIIIEDGLLTYPAAAAEDRHAGGRAKKKKKQPPLYHEIRNIEAEIDWPRHSRAADLTAAGLWHGTATNLAVRADNALLLMSGGQSPLRISFNSAKGGITFTGTAQAGQNFGARGSLAARSPGMDQTLAWLGLRLPFGTNMTTPFIWESELKADVNRTALSDIVLTIGSDSSGNSGRGALEIGYQNSRPQISGSLAFENLTVSLPAPALFAAAPAPDAAGRQPVDMPVFDLFGLDLRISADRAVFNTVPVNHAAASIQMQQSGLIFDIGTMQIFDGTAQSSLRLKSDKDRLTGLEARFSTTNTNLSRLQQAAGLFGFNPPPALQLRGKANINLTMQAALPEKQAQLPQKQKNRAAAAHKSKKREPGRKNRPERQQTQPSVAAPALSYYSIFARNIWPYAHGQFLINLNSGSMADFAMTAFIDRVKTGQPFALAEIYGAGKPAAFKFDRLEGKFTINKGALKPLSGIIIFGSHRLELQGEADLSANRLYIEGVFDPARQSDSGQCADVQCLQRSLVPALQFIATGAPFSTAPAGQTVADKGSKSAGNRPDKGVYITPKAEILPH